jgi:hypothetical protein
MKIKWLGFSLILLLVAFAINKDYSKQPNQLVTLSKLQSTTSNSSQSDVVDKIKIKLLVLGISDFTIENSSGELLIKYYSDYQTSFIQSYLEKEFQITVNHISKSNPTNNGFDGVIIVERKNEVNRNLDVSLNGVLKSFKNPLEQIAFGISKQLTGFTQKSYSNTEHNTANVRAGPSV